MLQIIETRLLSVVSHYYLAFLSISMAMFGMTAGAVWVYYRGERFTRERLPHDLTLFASAYGLSVVASLLLQISHAAVLVVSATMLVLWAELALVMATPFFFAGVVVSLALTRSHFRVALARRSAVLAFSACWEPLTGPLRSFLSPLSHLSGQLSSGCPGPRRGRSCTISSSA